MDNKKNDNEKIEKEKVEKETIWWEFRRILDRVENIHDEIITLENRIEEKLLKFK